MINDAIRKQLSGGARLTVDELAVRIGIPRAHIRAAVSEMVFRSKEITCDRSGRFTVGDPEQLLLSG